MSVIYSHVIPRPPRLTPTDEDLLRSCARYQYVTVEQWCRLFEDGKKLRYLQRRSRELARAGNDFLIRLYPTRPAGAGKAPSLFTHGLAGRAFAAALGLRVPARFRRNDLLGLSPQHLNHSEAITDVLIAFDLLARRDPRIEIADLVHERFLHEQRFKVRVPSAHAASGGTPGRVVEVVPDAFVRVLARVGGRSRRFPLIVEVDRDTEQQRAFREKIAALHAFATSGEFGRVYGARFFTVAFFVLAPRRDPARRLAEVVAWTERELTQRGLAHDGPAFGFCALDPAATPPETLLLGDCWYSPFARAPHPLIDLTADEGGA